MKLIWLILAMVVFILGCLFALLNAQPVRLNFFLGHVNWPLTVYLMIALFIGCLIGLAVGFVARKPRKS